jgi:uncharacterized integral membrane protein (TIGR00698 family)
VAGVTLLSTLCMIAYPVVVKLLDLEPRGAGIFLGGTIHDVAQVVGAGYSIGNDVGDFAVVSKLLRVAMLLPVVMLVTLVVRHRVGRPATNGADPLLPPFLIGFVLLVVIGSVGLIPRAVSEMLGEIARGCLVVAIAAVGLKTSPRELQRVGARAGALLVAEMMFLAIFMLVAQQVIK